MAGQIKLRDALAGIEMILPEIPQQHRSKVGKELESLLTYMVDSSGHLDLEEVTKVFQTVSAAVKSGDHSIFLQRRGRRWQPVRIDQFIEDPFFLGMRGQIWPKLFDELVDIFHGPDSEIIREIVLGGAIGCGKSLRAQVILAYQLYLLSCYHNPQVEYGLSSGSSIFFVFQSISLALAKKVLFDQFSQLLRRGEYFQKHFPYDKSVTSELRFPNDVTIMPIASNDTSALGLNVFSISLDEVNFQPVIEHSNKARFTGESEYNQAQKLYDTITRRIKSRFNRQGKVPGKVCIMSSAFYPGDFVSRKKAEVEDYKAQGIPCPIYFSSFSQWEAKPVGTFSEETFLVEVGDDTRRSRIITSLDEAVERDDVVSVPMDFYGDFRADIDAAIRDIAGIPVGGSNFFIKDRESLHEATKTHHQTYGGKQVFSIEEVDINSVENLENLLDKTFITDYLDSLSEYVVHVDLALTGDSCGLAIGHFGGSKDVGRRYDFDEGTKKVRETLPGQKPIFIIDGVLRIVPPLNDEIDINMVGDLIELLAAYFPVTYVSSDTYQSATLLQRLRRQRNYLGYQIKSTILSVDKSLAPYMEIKQSARDRRILLPAHEVCQRELRELKFDSKKQKVDHPNGGGKDCADAVAGVVYLINALTTNNTDKLRIKEGRPTVRRIRTGRPQIFSN